MSISIWVALVVMAVLGLWLLGARQRLRRLRAETVRAFGKLHDDLTRRHQRIADLVARANELSNLRDAVTPIAPNQAPATTPSIDQTLEAARQAADLAKAAPMVAAGITAVDRAEVALGLRLARLLASLGPTSANDDEPLQRLRRELDRDAPKIDYAAQAFNQAALTYNRAARETPTQVVARLFRFAEATVVSPNLGKPSSRRPKATAPRVAPAPSDHPAAVPVAVTAPADTSTKPHTSDSKNASSQ